jgi:hypothetical protein
MPSSNATSYTVQCSTDSSFINNVQSATSNTTSATVSSLNNESTYFCEVRALDASVQSTWSAQATTNTEVSAPSGLTVAGASTTSVSYSFSSIPNAASYNIQKSSNSGFTSPTTHNQTGLTGSFLGMSPSSLYYFRVQSVDSSGVPGPYSSVITASTYTNWGVYSLITGVGDWNGDGHNDIVAYNPTSGVFDLHLGLGTGQFGPAIPLYTPGTTVVNLIGPGILSGQTSPVLFWTQSSTGTPGYYLQSDGNTGYTGSAVASGTNYASYISVFAAPAFYTGKTPLYIGHTGSLYEEQLISGGTSSLLLNYGSGWDTSFPGNNVFGVGDFNGAVSGVGDIAGISSAGAMTIYPGTGTGTTGTTFSGGTGWTSNYVTGGWDYNGDGHPDILRLNTSGVLQLYEGSGVSSGTVPYYLNSGVPYTVN